MTTQRTKAEIAADARRTGRPTLPARALKTQIVALRLTRGEVAALRKAAKASGMTLSGYLLAPHRPQGKG
jgi:hypothetical protein